MPGAGAGAGGGRFRTWSSFPQLLIQTGRAVDGSIKTKSTLGFSPPPLPSFPLPPRGALFNIDPCSGTPRSILRLPPRWGRGCSAGDSRGRGMPRGPGPRPRRSPCRGPRAHPGSSWDRPASPILLLAGAGVGTLPKPPFAPRTPRLRREGCAQQNKKLPPRRLPSPPVHNETPSCGSALC